MPSYSDMARTVLNYYTNPNDLVQYGGWEKVFDPNNSYSLEQAYNAISSNPNIHVIKRADGTIAGWWNKSTGSGNMVSNIGGASNSNIAGGVTESGSLTNIETIPDVIETSPGKYQFSNRPKIKDIRWEGAGGVAMAVGAVATGLSLGVSIDKAIYEYNPFMFSDETLEKYNPEKWKQISIAVDEGWTDMGYPTLGKIGRMVCDNILGIDSTDNSTQMYIDEDAYTYFAAYLQSIGAFSSTINYPTYTAGQSLSTVTYSDVSLAIDAIAQFNPPLFNKSGFDRVFTYYGLSKKGRYGFDYLTGGSYEGYQYYRIYVIPQSSILNGTIKYDSGSTGMYSSNSYYYIKSNYYKTYECRVSPSGNEKFSTTNGYWEVALTPHNTTLKESSYPTQSQEIRTSNIGNITEDSLEGVESQSGAVLPSLSNATDIESVKTSLKQQYPDVWTNSVTKQVLQPDGTLKTFTYVPVPTPNVTDWMDTQPTGDGSQQNQKDTVVNPDMDSSIKDAISSSGSTGSDTPNPPDTGDGNSPTIVPPVGKASSLWSIYNPTLEQVNQFGSWLWSSNFVEQLKKLFSDPMQAIIGLHKVYSPVQTSGQGTIKCGYLDSGVTSKLVSEQYITVDCGSVDLQEYFGNVFDYPPYTEVSIYLPFIGIRQLDPSDVMRSTISVKYRIDVLTGACLAEVNVQRDAAGGTLYTFSGDAAVRYPVSSGSYMGIVSGLIGVATSVVSGNLLPALGGVTRLHTNVERSGSFTGNSGAMGSKVPYLIISRPQTAMADKFETLSGYPSNTYTLLSDCKGFTQVKYCHVENLSATETEKKEIESLLKEGVIL